MNITRLRSLWDAVAVRARNPIVMLELAASFRRKRFPIAFTLSLLAVLAILALVVIASIEKAPAKLGQATFTAYLATLGVVMALLFPAFGCASIVEERMQKSLDLLLVTRLEPWEIYAGKAAAAFIYSLIFLVGTIPLVGMSFLFGGVDPRALVALAALALALAAGFAAIATFASAASSTFVRAIAATYVLSWLFAAAASLASSGIFFRWILPSTGEASSGDIREAQELFEKGGDLIYLGTALFFGGVTAFAAIHGANQLKPGSYDRSSALRAFTALFLGALAWLWERTLARLILHLGPPDASSLVTLDVSALVIATLLAFLAVLVFSTETPTLSHRVRADVSRRWPLSPLRLLAPGPRRGALFSILLAGGLLTFLAWRLGAPLEPGWVPPPGASRANGLDRFGPRQEVILGDVALLLGTFLAFLAATGRLLAERARGTLIPRLTVASLAVVLTLGPALLLFLDDVAVGQRSLTGAAAARGTAVSRGYFLSPALALSTVLGVQTASPHAGSYYLFPQELPALGSPELTLSREGFRGSPLEARERRAWPLHRLATLAYGAMAVLAFALGEWLARGRERSAAARS